MSCVYCKCPGLVCQDLFTFTPKGFYAINEKSLPRTGEAFAQYHRLFSHTESGEDALGDILAHRLAGQLAHGLQRPLHIGEQGVGGDPQFQGFPGALHALQRPAGGLLLPLLLKILVNLLPPRLWLTLIKPLAVGNL